jgi:hypothetical protein
VAQFNILEPPLHSTAEGALTFLKDSMGLKGILIESQVMDFKELGFRPVIQGTTSDGSRICVDVAEKLRVQSSIVEFLGSCRTKLSPIKFFIIIPVGGDLGDPDYASHLKRCREHGIGVCTVDEDGTGALIRMALSQLAVGVRPIETSKFPKEFRADLQLQMETYLNGNPVKGCQGIGEMLEHYSRRVAKKARQGGFFSKTYNVDKKAWASLCEDMLDGLERENSGKQTPCHPISKKLVSRVHGYTDHRNEVSHKPKNLKELRTREEKVRTYFEQGADLLHELIVASKKLKP